LAVRRLVPLTVAALVVAVLATAATVVAGRPAHRSAATALASPATGVASSWVARENRRPGTTGWRITRLGAPYAIEGWADHVSAASGDRVGLFVSTTAPKFRVEAYRMGWYGGRGARLVWRSPQLPGRRQPPPARTPGTNLLVTRWRRSLTFTVRPAWPPGDYLLKLAASSGQRYVPLTVRDDASHSALVVQNDVTTWQPTTCGAAMTCTGGRTGRRPPAQGLSPSTAPTTLPARAPATSSATSTRWSAWSRRSAWT
jgi:hypothetical protein